MNCLIPDCENDTNGCDLCFKHHMEGFHNLNLVPMNPQPLLELNQVKSNNKGQWCHWEVGWGEKEMTPLLNQPKNAAGVAKKDGVWYWGFD
jgi:hypothetical protein